MVFSLSPGKVSDPDDFIRAFFKSCWDIIKVDIVVAIHLLVDLLGDCVSLINTANIILIPKKANTTYINNYRPISLIHSLTKIFSKLMASRQAPILDNIISKSQSAFIKKRCIHDNFLFVQNLAKELHQSKTPSLFLKLDISNGFDSVN